MIILFHYCGKQPRMSQCPSICLSIRPSIHQTKECESCVKKLFKLAVYISFVDQLCKSAE